MLSFFILAFMGGIMCQMQYTFAVSFCVSLYFLFLCGGSKSEVDSLKL